MEIKDISLCKLQITSKNSGSFEGFQIYVYIFYAFTEINILTLTAIFVEPMVIIVIYCKWKTAKCFPDKKYCGIVMVINGNTIVS